MNGRAFDTFALNDSKYEVKYENYLFAEGKSEISSSDVEEKPSEEFLVHARYRLRITEPRICTWDYLPKPEVTELLQLKKRSETRNFIASRLKKKPKGFPRIIFRELMYSVLKFCKTRNFNLEQSGACLSQFYLTHIFFTSSMDIGAEKVYEYFKNLQLCHSAPFPPKSIKLFNLEEIKNIMIYFCKLYLRNLPIVRFMSLPNFTLKAEYNIHPDEFIGKKEKKGKTNKKDKKGKKGKKKK